MIKAGKKLTKAKNGNCKNASNVTLNGPLNQGWKS